MATSLPIILAFDPGGRTGYCIWNPNREPLRPNMGELGPYEHHAELYTLIRNTYKVALQEELKLHVVCERFDFRKDDQQRDKIEYISREYIGVVKLFAELHQVPEFALFMAGAAEACGKTAFFGDGVLGNNRLRQLALWSSGQPHAMDAARHYLYHRTFRLKDDTILYRLK